MREPDGWRVGNKARFVVKDLVARSAERANREIDGLRDADRDKDLLLPVEGRVKSPLQVADDGLAELGRAEVRV